MGSKRIITLIAVSVLSLSLAGCGGGKQTDQVQEGEALAVIDGVPLEPSVIDARLSRMDAETRAQFNDPANLSMLIDREVRTMLLAAAARDEGLADSEEYKEVLESARMSILADIYSRQLQREAANISDDDLLAAYERDKHLYSSDTVTKARHIVCSTEREALEALEAVRGGMPFEEAVARFSKDSYTKDRGGDLGSITRKSVIPGLGAAPDFVDAINRIEEGDVGGPINTRAGYHIVQVAQRVEGNVPSFEEIRGALRRRIEKERSESGLTTVMQRLWDKYDVTVNDVAIKKYIGFPTTPEGLMRTLKEATSTGDKIKLCEEMVNEFPNNKYAPYMLFTKGFVLSEELHNYVEAEAVFKELLQRYPNSNYIQAARWMIENMGDEHPPLRNVEDVVNRAKGSSG